MQVDIYLKTSREPITFKGDRIDIKDLELDGIKYKQIRYFKKLVSKSTYIKEDDISRIKEHS
ncbi:hypothetical protein RBU49_09710 [Clostridium sp. MB40-C1]|uniref:hypothetical protein n=1 Tax=Clostridium sp. MB40-C1 TaxID=3070996 RepID=UPI0027E17142|nr:hypothetical protein [Clostridium sp. MB40-C1]WMJ79168.1 hypothetical protein RBU49_09710 [Clostridium sp. MB40-C1]